MGLRQESRDIDGMQVTCVQFSVMRGLGMLPRISRTIGPVLERIAVSAPTDAMNMVVLSAFTHIDGAEAQSVVRDILAGCTVTRDGRMNGLSSDEAINAAFAGNLAGLAKAVLFALEVNFGTFLDVPGASESDPPVQPEAPSSTSTTTSPRPGRRVALSSRSK